MRASAAKPTPRCVSKPRDRPAASLNHPHIVAVHDSGEHHGTPFIVMERLSGHSLADEIARGPLPQPQVWQVLDDVLAAVAVTHDAGILHRDIKPGNILFTTTGDAKVTDFGIAKTAEGGFTTTGQIVGTMAYLSPGRLMGNPATPTDDLYAVGVVGYEALTGRRPFMQENLGALARAIMDDQPPALRALRPDVDPVLAATIERAMARDPGWRFRDTHRDAGRSGRSAARHRLACVLRRRGCWMRPLPADVASAGPGRSTQPDAHAAGCGRRAGCPDPCGAAHRFGLVVAAPRDRTGHHKHLGVHAAK